MTAQYSHEQQHAYTPHYAPPAPRNGLGLTALILGLVALPFTLTGLTAWLAIILGVIAVPLAIAGLGRVRHGHATNKGTTIAGLVAGLLAVVLGIASTVVTLQALDEALSGPTATDGPLTVAVGQAVDVEGLRVTVTEVEVRGAQFSNNRLTCATVAYENGTGETADRNGFDWSLRDPDGASVSTWIYTGDDALSSGPIAPGGRAEGVVCFDVPRTVGGWAVEYRAGLSSEPTAVWTWTR